jgi:hypothetical protein
VKPELLFLQLNEINFDVIKSYLSNVKKNELKNLKYIINNFKFINTHSEKDYKNLEPWIQWPSVYLGKDFNNHKIFRLGDIVKHSYQKQIFETIEEKGYQVGAISPMNAENRMKKPSYFIPDPWTDTNSDDSKFSKKISALLKQTVNDNSSGKISLKSIFTIFQIIFKTLNYKNTLFLISLSFSTLTKPWKKSLVLDYLIHLIHLYLYKQKNPSFSSVFFNAGAHIQHHYFYNSTYIKNLPKNPNWYIASKFDPIQDMLIVYDKIIEDYIELYKNGKQLIISTGLRQIPYDIIKFYYRLKNHSSFLNKIGVKCLKVLPKMTRDFEIIFGDKKDCIISKNILEKIILKKNNIKIFEEIEIRNKSLFISLTYPHEIKKDDYIVVNNNLELNLFNEVNFVAIKNGMHDGKGYLFSSPNINLENSKYSFHVSEIYNMILKLF